MKRITPLLTLLTGAGMAAVLFAMSAQAAPRTTGSKAAATSAATAPAPPDGSPAPGPTPSADPPGQPPAQPSEQRGRTGTPSRPPAPSVTANWTGRLDGGATIAITATDGTAVAYVCDGKRLEIWLRGTAADGRLKLTGKKDATLTGTFGDGRAAGEVVVGDRRWAFTAKASATPAPVLYRASTRLRQAGVDGGWIMLPDGSQIGVVTRNGSPAPAPPLDPAFGTTIVDGMTVTAEPVAPDPGTPE